MMTWRAMVLSVVCVGSVVMPIQSMAQTAHPLVKNSMVVPKLDGAALLPKLYAGKTFAHRISLKDMEPLPNIGVRGAEGDDEVALIHAARFYRNPQNQERAWVMVERHEIDSSSNELKDCHVCAPEVDIFVFARQDNGWKLVSSTSPKSEIMGAWGETQLKSTAKVMRVSEQSQALLYESGYGNQGEFSTELNAIVLHEQRPIQAVEIAQTSYDNSGYYGDSKQAYSFEGKYVLSKQADKQGRYVLNIRYSGSNKNQAGKIRPYRVTKRFYWHDGQNKFLPLK